MQIVGEICIFSNLLSPSSDRVSPKNSDKVRAAIILAFSTVRGYCQDTFVADNGFFASIALQICLFQIPEWDGFPWLRLFYKVL
jgi:hypothetical protein